MEVSWNLDNNGWNPIPACSNIKCKENYKWNGQACVADEKPNQACNPLPANAQWLAGNTGTVTQVWNGSQGAWLPSLTGIYNKT